ncbi:class I SAM-dependent methyltransferase [Leucothrix sargassi]|nr:class I SAM-dependent methyltransferase [Leucothrix sargassi]
MDKKTIASYDESYQAVAKLHHSLSPAWLYELITQHFTPNTSVLDVGCGTGRDCAWLAQNGYAPTGVDASLGMLTIAKESYPSVRFIKDALPELATIASAQYENVLCSAVIMHLPSEQLMDAATHLLRVAKAGGCVLLTYRGSPSADNRESGKLYTPYVPSDVVQVFEQQGATLISHTQNTEEERGHVWENLVFRINTII